MTSTAATANQLVAEPRPPRGRSLAEVLVDLRDRIRNGEPIIHTLPTGWDLLDETVGGLVRGEYVGLIAAPGVGKSTLADQVVVATLLRNPDARAIIFALETSTAVRAARLVATRCVTRGHNDRLNGCAPIRALLHGELREAGKMSAVHAADELASTVGTRLHYIDNITDDLAIADVIRANRPDVLLVDHLGIVTSTSQSASETAKMDESLAVLLAAIREGNSAAIIINEMNKSGLVTGKVDLVASRGSARFASLAGLYVGIERAPFVADRRDPILVATIHKSRFGDSFKQQAATFFGGLCHFEWGPVSDVKQKAEKARKRGGSVPRKATEAAEDDGDSRPKPTSKKKRKRST